MELTWVMTASNLFVAFIVSALAIPMVRGQVAPNRWYGIRIKKAFESDEAWYAINRYGGKILLRLSLLVALAGLCGLLPPINRSEGAQVLLGLAPLIYLVGLIPILRFANRWSGDHPPPASPGA